jgi:hypothetical protein
MNYEDILNIINKLGLNKNNIEIVVFKLNNIYNKTISNSIIIIF